MQINRRELALVGIFAGIGTAAGLTANVVASSNAETEVAEAVEAFRQAMVNGDGDTLNALAEDGLSFGHSNGVVQTKGEFIGSVVHKKEIFKSIDLTEKQLTVVGDVGIERHIFSSEILLDGKDLSVELGVVEVWKKTDERWKLLVRQAFQT